MENNNISLKAVVDKSNNRVVFVESNEKFVDIVFSFLTMPMGSVVRLTRNRPPAASIGCMNNLYNSVEILDKRYLRTEACKTMLLYPRNGAGNECKNLKLVINDGVQMRYFVCETDDCANSNYKLLSHYRNAICRCGNRMNWGREVKEREPTRVVFDDQDEGVFVKGPIQLTISYELQVMPSSTPDLDATQHLRSKETTAMLVSPKLAPGFSYEGQPLNIEEYMHQPYYYVITQGSGHFVTSDEMLIHSGEAISSSVLTVIDPKSPCYDNLSTGRGFLKGPAMFTITDDLTITPLSSVTGLSAIRKLKVPFSDLEEHIVYVGKEEASRLLVASFVSETALTNTFLLKESEQGS
ncbi:hypothetical protein COLO4_19076 [Corchorus olitorius]|uniref:DUF674 domain-containing protein n=1 Tax=Corchorus olitorius TaxID=93759 RepID=A0A1R3J6U9_9ROSI|nr:hypothetical protein COLO4_19076 [Corchorus olitorius]